MNGNRSVPSNFMSDIEYSVITNDVIKSFDCICAAFHMLSVNMNRSCLKKAMPVWRSPKLRHTLANIYGYFVRDFKYKKRNWIACAIIYEFIMYKIRRNNQGHARDVVDVNVSHHSKQ